MVLTATASPKVVDDILSLLKLRNPVQKFIYNGYRTNLFYDVMFKEPLGKDAIIDCKEFAETALWSGGGNTIGVGIIYCRKRDTCEDIATQLSMLGLRTIPYHAGLSAVERRTV